MLVSLPALNDNYIWLYARENLPTIIVDPADAEPVLDYMKQNQLELEAILLTHKHLDHVGGVEKIKQNLPHLPVFGSLETADWADYVIEEGIFFTPHYQIQAIATGGHTEQHFSFLLDQHLFCGDALFSLGCGRVFTQNYEQMFSSLQKLKQLPDDTIVCPAHEYTLANAKFAQLMEPKNQTLADYLQQILQWRTENKPTLPTTMALEKNLNPFLQVDNLADFIRLRQAKDVF